jgi:hypothetical protein
MASYVGFYDMNQDWAASNAQQARAGDGGMDPQFAQLVTDLPNQLPEGCSVVSSYGTNSANRPNVMIVETDNQSDLTFITNYYRGYLMFDWVPANNVGGSQAEREAWRARQG